MNERQISIYFDEPVELFVKEVGGQYVPASNNQILMQARIAASSIFPKGKKFSSAAVVKDFIQGKLTGLGHEVFCCFFLDSQYNLISYKEMTSGTIDQSAVYIREVAKVALKLNASAVVLAHNHPSGKAEPSSADINITKQAQNALNLLNIRVLDHILVAGSGVSSFAEKGLM